MVGVILSNVISVLSGMRKMADANDGFKEENFLPFCEMVLSLEDKESFLKDWIHTIFKQEDEDGNDEEIVIHLTSEDYDWIVKLVETYLQPPKTISKKEYNNLMKVMNELTIAKPIE